MRPHGSMRLPQYVKGGLAAASVVLAVQGFGPFAGKATAAEMTMVLNGEFAPTEKLDAFKAMTFVIDLPPGLDVPAHSHGGRSQVLLLSGEITVKDLDGAATVYKTGDIWIEEAGDIHSGVSTGSETARIVWTVLLPDGAELDIPHKP